MTISVAEQLSQKKSRKRYSEISSPITLLLKLQNENSGGELCPLLMVPLIPDVLPICVIKGIININLNELALIYIYESPLQQCLLIK